MSELSPYEQIKVPRHRLVAITKNYRRTAVRGGHWLVNYDPLYCNGSDSTPMVRQMFFRFWTKSQVLRIIVMTEVGTFTDYLEIDPSIDMTSGSSEVIDLFEKIIAQSNQGQLEALKKESEDILSEYDGSVTAGRYYIREFTKDRRNPFIFTVRALSDMTILVDSSNCSVFNLIKKMTTPNQGDTSQGPLTSTSPVRQFHMTPHQAIELHQLVEDIRGESAPVESSKPLYEPRIKHPIEIPRTPAPVNVQAQEQANDHSPVSRAGIFRFLRLGKRRNESDV